MRRYRSETILEIMARRTPEAILKPFEQTRQDVRHCQFPGCKNEGEHRAPLSREKLSEYYWFCLEHIRGYNLAWNYYGDMNEEEIEKQRRSDTVWWRPTWPMGQFNSINLNAKVRDGFGFFSEGSAAPEQTRAQSEEDKALAVLDLKHPVTAQEVKSRYKQLAKKLHPDANGDDAEAEERLKLINQAYATLKASFS